MVCNTIYSGSNPLDTSTLNPYNLAIIGVYFFAGRLFIEIQKVPIFGKIKFFNNLRNNMKNIFLFLFSSLSIIAVSQNGYWQQHVDYRMVIDVNVDDFTYDGEQKLVYTNNSPDSLTRVFYHLYFNAFKPGSDQAIVEEFPLLGEEYWNEECWGDVSISSLSQDGDVVNYVIEGTILEVELHTPIAPGEKTILDMRFFVKTPSVIQRSGKNSKDGVAFSMSQWYPKLCEYDKEGWHANPYIGREFHGVWGDFDVTINIDKNYTVAASGYLQNPELIGHGYAPLKEGVDHKNKISWRFIAPNVHDFSWAADPDYIHDKIEMSDGPTMHFFYKSNVDYRDHWKNFQKQTTEIIKFYSDYIGEYPYNQYSVIMAGEGAMEYAMCTFIEGYTYDHYRDLLEVTAHEIAHTWFQFLLATNESKHAWMDEGFTSYIESVCINEILDEGYYKPSNRWAYSSYFRWANSGIEEPLTTHADRFTHSSGYWMSSYDKGSIFLSQLGYIIGEENLKKTLRKYFKDWSFKHPTPNDFIRCAEKVSNLELDWYLMDWCQTTKTIDYAVSHIGDLDGEWSYIQLERVGEIPMPIDVTVTLYNGQEIFYNIPLTMMRGNKPLKGEILLQSWSWANPDYSFKINQNIESVKDIVIDPIGFMADVDISNNSYQIYIPKDK